MGHVFARLTGFGMTLIPIWPYTFDRVEHRPGSVKVTRWAGDTAHTAVVTGPADVELTGAESPGEVVEVLTGPAGSVWRIETSPFTIDWPEGFSIDSPPADDNSSPFLLFGPAGSAIYLQGPYRRDRIPPLTQLAGPGQTLVDQQSAAAFDAVELEYEQGGNTWRQTHHLVDLGDERLVITAQTPATHGIQVRAAAELMARSVTATRSAS
ncbi:hypothetical protein [Kutzneria chonburiensis]|uniref:Uncharacterized protein n=1 Tax=Kutzneria chonburiensis TaxID=1483604 RepID=A0ABV6N8K6_9PSEU|nr:hypothetical protein [Kutzneria chonburiensis]